MNAQQQAPRLFQPPCADLLEQTTKTSIIELNYPIYHISIKKDKERNYVMSLISLTYVSSEARPMTDDDLMAILNTARNFNPTKDITGLLLYRKGYFIQALEGEEADVTALFEKIKQDPRHTKVLCVSQEPIDRRSFQQWSMGFQNLDKLDPAFYNAHRDLLEATFTEDFYAKAPTRAERLLHLFVEETNY